MASVKTIERNGIALLSLLEDLALGDPPNRYHPVATRRPKENARLVEAIREVRPSCG